MVLVAARESESGLYAMHFDGRLGQYAVGVEADGLRAHEPWRTNERRQDVLDSGQRRCWGGGIARRYWRRRWHFTGECYNAARDGRRVPDMLLLQQLIDGSEQCRLTRTCVLILQPTRLHQHQLHAALPGLIE